MRRILRGSVIIVLYLIFFTMSFPKFCFVLFCFVQVHLGNPVFSGTEFPRQKTQMYEKKEKLNRFYLNLFEICCDTYNAVYRDIHFFLNKIITIYFFLLFILFYLSIYFLL